MPPRIHQWSFLVLEEEESPLGAMRLFHRHTTHGFRLLNSFLDSVTRITPLLPLFPTLIKHTSSSVTMLRSLTFVFFHLSNREARCFLAPLIASSLSIITRYSAPIGVTPRLRRSERAMQQPFFKGKEEECLLA